MVFENQREEKLIATFKYFTTPLSKAVHDAKGLRKSAGTGIRGFLHDRVIGF